MIIGNKRTVSTYTKENRPMYDLDLEHKISQTIDKKPRVIVDKRKKKDAEPEFEKNIAPISRFVAMGSYWIARIEPDDIELPPIPDKKKADEDYNSVDYLILSFNMRNGGIHQGNPV